MSNDKEGEGKMGVGLYRKFDVRRCDATDLPGGKHYGCEYFVLDLTHDQHALTALLHYAQAAKDSHPELSDDLFKKVGAWGDTNISEGKYALGDFNWPDSPTIDCEEFETEAEALAYIAAMPEKDRDFYESSFVLVTGKTWLPDTGLGADVTDQMHCQYGDGIHDGSDNIFLDDDLTGHQLKQFEAELDAAITAVCRKWIRPILVWEKVRDISPDEVEEIVKARGEAKDA